MSKSLWKRFNIKYSEFSEENSLSTLVFNRRSIITDEFLNNPGKIYNGIKFFEITILSKMIGFKFGEFAPTRKFPEHKKKKTKNTLKKK